MINADLTDDGVVRISVVHILIWKTTMSESTVEKLAVQIYAVGNMSFEGQASDLEEVYPDIYAPKKLGGDKEDLGAEEYRFSVNGENEMVMVDKGLLLALIDQCQRESENEAVHDDTRSTSYNWKDLNKVVLGMKFSENITNNNSHK
jgi:hypothetical protein